MLTQKREMTLEGIGKFFHNVNVDGGIEKLLDAAKKSDAANGALLEYHYFKSVAIQGQAAVRTAHVKKDGTPHTIESAQKFLEAFRGNIGRVADPVKKVDRMRKDSQTLSDEQLASMGLKRVVDNGKAKKSA